MGDAYFAFSSTEYNCHVSVSVPHFFPQFDFNCSPWLTPIDASWIYCVLIPMFFIANCLIMIPILTFVCTVLKTLFGCKDRRQPLQANRVLLFIIAGMIIIGFMVSVSLSAISMDIKQTALTYSLLNRKDIPSMNNFATAIVDVLWPVSFLVSLYSFGLQFLYGLTAAMLILGVILLYRRKKQQSVQITDEETGKVKQEIKRTRVPLSFCTKILLLMLLLLVAECTISSMFGGMTIQRLCTKAPEILTTQYFTEIPKDKQLLAVPYFFEAAYYGYVQPNTLKHSLFYDDYIKLFFEAEILSEQLGIGQVFNNVKSQLVLCNGTYENEDIIFPYPYSYSQAIAELRAALRDSSEKQGPILTLRNPKVLPFYAAKDKMADTLNKLQEVMSLSNCRRIKELWALNWDIRVCTHAQTGLLVMSIVGLLVYGVLLAAVAPNSERRAWMLFWLCSSFLIFTFISWSTFV